MRVVVIGLGSMGKRRVRLIKELYSDFEVVGVDARQDRQEEAAKQSGITTFSSLDELASSGERYDCAFICTQPLSHANIITACLEKGWNVFTELNLVDDGYDRNIALAKERGVILFMSSTFLYREETRFIRKNVRKNIGENIRADAASIGEQNGQHGRNGQKLRCWNYIYHIGQYLPDWHPWESYKDFFVGDKRTNGCREILSVELPWLIATFGNIEKLDAVSDKMTGLDIDYDDNFMIQVKHSNGNKGCLVVDVVSPNAVRNFTAYTEGAYLSWGGNPKSVFAFDTATKELKNVVLTEQAEHRDGYASFVVENAYKNEIREFFNAVLNGKKPEYSFEQDKAVLALIKEIGA